MRRCVPIAAFVAAAFLASGCAGRASRAVSPAATAPLEIPFVLTEKNNLVIDARLDDATPLRLMLHTAASDVSLTSAATAKIASLRFADTAEIGAWGGRTDARFSAGHGLRIGAMAREGVTVWEVQDSGDGTDGKFGLDFFGERVVVVDFQRGRLRVYDALPAEAADYERLVAERTNGAWYVEAGCVVGQTTHPHRFLLHSGYSGGVLLDDAFAAAIGAREALPVVEETTLSDSFGNKIAVRKTVLPGLIFGGARLTDVPAGFFPGNLGNQRISVIGGEVIRRFDLIFDLRQNAVYARLRRDGRPIGGS